MVDAPEGHPLMGLSIGSLTRERGIEDRGYVGVAPVIVPEDGPADVDRRHRWVRADEDPMPPTIIRPDYHIGPGSTLIIDGRTGRVVMVRPTVDVTLDVDFWERACSGTVVGGPTVVTPECQHGPRKLYEHRPAHGPNAGRLLRYMLCSAPAGTPNAQRCVPLDGPTGRELPVSPATYATPVAA
ncbi:MAG: hypothetical protein OJJ54_24975 [Pseudonocardia sp.]|nr:hypothetical protein [Pseudonocardia sp.]